MARATCLPAEPMQIVKAMTSSIRSDKSLVRPLSAIAQRKAFWVWLLSSRMCQVSCRLMIHNNRERCPPRLRLVELFSRFFSLGNFKITDHSSGQSHLYAGAGAF